MLYFYLYNFHRLGSGKQIHTVIVDNGKDQDDEDDLFVVEDNAQNDLFHDEVFDFLYCKYTFEKNFCRKIY